jgi:glycyl-tRNA synthetase beta chain
MDRKDALLEIGCEELPVEYIAPALRQMHALAEKKLTEARLPFSSLETEATPRRLVLMIKALGAEQPQMTKTVAGPTVAVAQKPDGTLTPAGEGFLRKLGVPREQIKIQDGRWLVTVTEKSRSAQELLPGIFLDILRGLSFPKSMRWETEGVRFARPVRWLLALFGPEVVPFQFGDVVAGRHTRLHPLAAQRQAEIVESTQYRNALEQGRVCLSSAERKQQIQQGLEDEAHSQGGRVLADEELLDMVTMMAEAPRVLSGGFAPSFLELPREIVITAMREHQRYFAVENEDGRLLPWFLAVYDNPLADPVAIRPGCERVLEARLKDAEFFYHEDLKRPLMDRIQDLDRVLWIKGLGSMLDKTRRLEILAGWLAQTLEPEAVAETVEAAHLCKADLVTHMVQEKEFTSLQGIMGTYYALAQGVPQRVAQALREHYQPRAAGDACPQTAPGRMLALADKFDHLTGCWGSGLIPTGTKDPYALRRAAQGIVTITLTSRYRFSLAAALRQALLGFPQFSAQAEEIVRGVQAFILGRLETELAQREIPADVMQAVLGVGSDDACAVLQKAEALMTLRRRPAFPAAVTAFSRVVNILPKDTTRVVPAGAPELETAQNLFTEPAERELYTVWLKNRDKMRLLAEAGDYPALFECMSEWVPAIDRFFEEVLVMAPDEKVRRNRLNLLANLARSFWLLADFSRLVPEPA